MLSVLRDIILLIKIGKTRSLEAKGDTKLALNRLRSIRYTGTLEGFRRTYVARLMVINNIDESLKYVREVSDFIIKNAPKLQYSEYCKAYCVYLEKVLMNFDTKEAAREVNDKPASSLVKNSLIVT